MIDSIIAHYRLYNSWIFYKINLHSEATDALGRYSNIIDSYSMSVITLSMFMCTK